MAKLTAEAVWLLGEQELLELFNSEALVPKPRKVRFYAPSFTFYKTASFCNSNKEFPTISVTGNNCQLKCRHCGGIVLETMLPAKTPEKFFALCQNLKKEGAVGVLVSGGCRPDGSVPLEGVLEAIAKTKRELGLTVFVHTGIVDAEAAQKLKFAGVDAALIDIIGSDETIREIYNLRTSVRKYNESLKALSEASLDFVPHIVVGLQNGKLSGELNAINVIKNHSPSGVVVISFMPIHGTAMEKTTPPKPIEIARTAAAARVSFPQTPLVLGCMRPKGKNRAKTDILALKAGVDGVAFPSEEAIRYARNHGYDIAFSSFCCAQIYKDLTAKAGH